jgi:hypothetical protein
MTDTQHPDEAEVETHQPTLTCVECGSEIHLGEERTHTEDGIHHLACIYARELRDTFHFFIGNTDQTDQVSMSMWYEDEDREYPVLQNRDGKNAILSRIQKNSDKTPPSNQQSISPMQSPTPTTGSNHTDPFHMTTNAS